MMIEIDNPPSLLFKSRNRKIELIQHWVERIRVCSDGVALHLGCGYDIFEGMVNCDAFNPSADVKVDAKDLSEFKSEFVYLIETHHMIEHLTLDEFDECLMEWNSTLALGGCLIMTTPNLSSLCWKWLYYSLQSRFRKSGYWQKTLNRMFYGSQENPAMFHKSGFDAPFLQKTIAKYGFETIFCYTPYPLRSTPSLLSVSIKKSNI